APVYAATLLCGYASTIVLDAIGLSRRGLLRHALVLVLTPLYWFLLSLAAWRALIQLWRDPQRWEKTAHGLARTSRMPETRSLETDGRRANRAEPRPRGSHEPFAPTATIAAPRARMLEAARRMP